MRTHVSERLGLEVLTTTHLLTDHNDERTQSSATVAGDCEELGEAGNIVTLLPENIGLNLKLSMDIVEVSSCRGM